MLIIRASDLRNALPMNETISAMKAAYAALSAGRAEVPLRTRLSVEAQEGTCLIMPAYVKSDLGEVLSLKVVTLYQKNPTHGFPLIHAAVLAIEAETGRFQALLEGSVLTAIRTGAASGAATDLLARPDSRVAAIFGAGVQGRTQLEAICTVRAIQMAWIYDPSPPQVERFISEMAGKEPVPEDLRPASSPEQAVANADIICTATTSTSPVFEDRDLKPGVHINGVGSYTPEMQEVPTETVARALLVVDSRSASLVEAGDLVKPIREGLITAQSIHAELGEIVLNQKPGRSQHDQITFFKSVGVAVQDALAAQLALQNAVKLGLGQQVDWI